MVLAQRLQEMQRAASAARPRRPQHLELLQVFADHGRGASVGDRLEFLQRLRKTQDDLRDRSKRSPADSRMRLQRWTDECMKHQGFECLREELFSQEGFKNMSDGDLSRTFNQLRRMGLSQEADKLMPAISSRLSSGQLADLKVLLGIWSVAPQELLPELDAPLARAVADGDPRPWDLLSAVSRAVDFQQSKAVLRCAEALGGRLRDLSSADLAAIGAHLGTRLRAAGTAQDAEDAEEDIPAQFADLVRRSKAELLSRDGTLDNQQLCGLIGTLEGRDDALWRIIRTQLLERQDLSGAQLLEICRFIHRSGGSKEEPKLFRHAVIHLRKLLNQKAEPGLVALVERNLEAIMPDERVCQSLLNTAVRLRKDLYPSVLWTLFIRCGEVQLVSKYPSLQARMTRVGEMLEEHGVQRHKMPLQEMAGAAEAMRANGTVLKKSLQQMVQQFVEVHAEVMRNAEAAETDSAESSPDSTSEEPKDSPLEAAKAAAKRAQPRLGRAASPEGTNWLGEVQRLAISFWLQLHSLDAEAQELTTIIRSFCTASGRCQIEASELMSCIADLSASEAEEAPQLAEALTMHLSTRVPELDQGSLVKVAQLAATLPGSEDLWRPLIAEVNRRLPRSGLVGVAKLRKGVDFDNSVAILTALRAAPTQDEALAELVQRLVNLTVESLPTVMSLEPEAAGQRFGNLVGAVAELGLELGVLSDNTILMSLRSCLHRIDGATLGGVAGAAEIAFSYTALCRGSMPLDATARLWRILGDSLSDQTGGTDADNLSPRQGAGLLAFGLAARHLSSCSTAAALQLAPEATAVEALLNRLISFESTRRSSPCFDLDQESPEVSTMLERLQKAVVREIMSAGALQASLSELSQERFQVPGTPYIVDLAFPGQRLAILVPRAEHRALGGGLSGVGALAERLFEALGWRLQWVHVDELKRLTQSVSSDTSSSSEDASEAIRKMLGKSVEPTTADSSVSISSPQPDDVKGMQVALA